MSLAEKTDFPFFVFPFFRVLPKIPNDGNCIWNFASRQKIVSCFWRCHGLRDEKDPPPTVKFTASFFFFSAKEVWTCWHSEVSHFGFGASGFGICYWGEFCWFWAGRISFKLFHNSSSFLRKPSGLDFCWMAETNCPRKVEVETNNNTAWNTQSYMGN